MSVRGLILCNLHDSTLPQLTASRTMGAVPFGGRYRLIDFPLSAMAHAGVERVDIIAHRNYAELLEHIGDGRAWDLARRDGGVRVVPPYTAAPRGAGENYHTRLQTLASICPYLDTCEEQDVLCAECDVIGTPDLSQLLAAHRAGGAVFTVGVEHNGTADEMPSLHIFVASRVALCRAVRKACAQGDTSFERDVLAQEWQKGNVAVFRFADRLCRVGSFTEYFQLHLRLLESAAARRELLGGVRPLLTRFCDLPPTRYEKSASLCNSLLADGCVIGGTVRNCVLAPGVFVGKGCVAENAVLSAHSRLESGARVSTGIVGAGAVLAGNTDLKGHPAMPFFVPEAWRLR